MTPEPRLQTCVECGAQVERLAGGLCPACFVRRQPLLAAPTTLDVELCAHCDARHVGAHWFDPDEADDLQDIREAAVRAAVTVDPRVQDPLLQVEETQQDERTFPTQVTLDGSVDGAALHDGATVLVRMRRAVCDRCSRMFGGYYAAILQLRATERDVTGPERERVHRIVGGELDRMRATGNRDAFLTKSNPVPGGFDYYLGDIDAGRIVARLVAQRLGAQVTETAKLVGRREGEDIYRVTFLIRINPFARGDFARLAGGASDDGRIVQVLSQERGRAVVLDLATRKRDKVDAEDLKRLGGAEVLEEAVLVSQDAGHLQVLDPVTLRTVDVVRPPEYHASGASVRVLRDGDHLLAVPGPAAEGADE